MRTKTDIKEKLKANKPIIIGIIIYLLLQLCFDKGYIKSGSMEPTLMTGKTVVYESVSPLLFGVRRGDIIEFKRGNEILSKRVIGIGGDNIQIKDGTVYLNGQALDEKYLPQDTVTEPFSSDEYIVPEGCVFLLGDNRANSADARLWQDPYVDIKNVKGKLLFVFSW